MFPPSWWRQKRNLPKPLPGRDASHFCSHVTVHGKPQGMPNFQGGKRCMTLSCSWKEEGQVIGGRICVHHNSHTAILWWGQDSLGLINLGKAVFRKPYSLLSAYSPCTGFLCFADLWHGGRCHHNTNKSPVGFRADLWQVPAGLPQDGAWHEVRRRKPACQVNSSVPGIALDTVFFRSHGRIPAALQGRYHFPHLSA